MSTYVNCLPQANVAKSKRKLEKLSPVSMLQDRTTKAEIEKKKSTIATKGS